MNPYHHALLTYLRRIPEVEILGVFDLAIGRTVYPAVRYKLTRPVSPGCPAYDRGERASVEERFAVSGALPPSYVRNPGSTRSLGRHYQFDDVEGEWFVIGWMSADLAAQLAPEQRRYHPEIDGEVLPNFTLGQWTSDIPGLERARITKGSAVVVTESSCGGAVR